jgi:hypothetical protein
VLDANMTKCTAISSSSSRSVTPTERDLGECDMELDSDCDMNHKAEEPMLPVPHRVFTSPGAPPIPPDRVRVDVAAVRSMFEPNAANDRLYCRACL